MGNTKNVIAAICALTLMAQAVLHGGNPSCGNGSPGGPGCPPCAPCNGSAPPPSCPQAGPNPFNTTTANAFRDITDLEVWGGVGEHQLAFKRYGMSRYNGSLKWFGDGHTWRHSYQWELVSDGTNALRVYKPDGAQWRYVLSGGAWRGTAANTDALTQSGSDFFLRTALGFRYRFHSFTDANNAVYYLLLDFTDSAGNVYTLTYDASRRLVQITEPAGVISESPTRISRSTKVGSPIWERLPPCQPKDSGRG